MKDVNNLMMKLPTRTLPPRAAKINRSTVITNKVVPRKKKTISAIHQRSSSVTCYTCKETFKNALLYKAHKPACTQYNRFEDPNDDDVDFVEGSYSPIMPACEVIYTSDENVTIDFTNNGNPNNADLIERNGTISSPKDDPLRNVTPQEVQCDANSDPLENLDQHMQNSVQPSEGIFIPEVLQFTCKKGGEKFSTAGEAEIHLHQTHATTYNSSVSPKSSIYSCACQICEIQFQRLSELEGHMLNHLITTCSSKLFFSPIYNIACKTCETKFEKQEEFDNHLKLHPSASSFRYVYACTTCDAKFATLKLLINHREEHVAWKYPYTCMDCHIKFQNVMDYDSHEQQYHISNPLIQFSLGSYNCKKCMKKFTKMGSCETHIRRFHRSEDTRLKNHQRNKLSDVKNPTNQYKYHCNRCKKRYVTEKGYLAHLKQHVKPINYECDTCKKVFKKKRTLVVHVFTHMDVLPYECTACRNKFRTCNSAYQHALLHTGMMMYKCDICGEKFAQKAGLCGHRKKNHPGKLPPMPTVMISHVVKKYIKERKAARKEGKKTQGKKRVKTVE